MEPSAPAIRYAEIILPLHTGAYTYAIPPGMEIGRGSVVVVPLGRSKIYTGVVRNITDTAPKGNIREIISASKEMPPISSTRLRLWDWVADYYMCERGDVMRAAIPSALKPSGWDAGEVETNQYREPTEQYLRLGRQVTTNEMLHEAFETLSRKAKKQYDTLLEITSLIPEGQLFTGGSVPRRLTTADYAPLNQLIKKGLVETFTTTTRPEEQPPVTAYLPKLSPKQQAALDEINDHFSNDKTVLLHGVTGSGKTEIYIRLIAEQLHKGRDVLYLLPEIAMTGQLVGRIKKFFGERVVTYHSSYTPARKTQAWVRAARSTGGTLVIGVRSSVFLPGENTGLVIVDEEHDPSYKSQEGAPRYNARDTAVVLAGMTGARTVLGSATPSLESYANALTGKYGYVQLDERYGGATLPHVIVSDTVTAAKRGERRSHFNKVLLDNIARTLAENRQVMLFQNRRGFSPYVECGECGWTASCPNCNVTLTYHKAGRTLRCHYCGHTEQHPLKCPACQRPAVEPRGFGTEKIEEELAPFFPEARIERLDRDTATSATRFTRIIDDFARGCTDILVGTQMITKGFDFEGVSLVGVLNADNLLAYPDFRASERAFQLLTQVAGRAGRRTEQGLVIIQTSQPTHPVVQQAAAGDYGAMARGQLTERKQFFYPPYCRIISVHLRHTDRALVNRTANHLSTRLRAIFGKRVCGPQPPPVDRVRGEYIENLLLKIERDGSFSKARKLLAEEIKALTAHPEYKKVTVLCDVDPI